MKNYNRKVGFAFLIFFTLIGFSITMGILTRIYIEQEWPDVLLALGVFGLVLIGIYFIYLMRVADKDPSVIYK